MKNTIKHFWVDTQLMFSVVNKGVFNQSYVLWFLLLFCVILFILQWLFNLEQLVNVMSGDNGLSFWGKIDFLIDAFFNIFRQIDNLIPISMVLISFLQAAAIVLYLQIRKVAKSKASKATVGSLTVGLVGAGCVACGGSVLTPLLGAVAVNVSVGVAESISDVLLVLAVILSWRALSKVSAQYANMVVK